MINIKPYRVLLILSGCILLLFVGHAIGMTLKFGFGEEFALGFVPLTDFDREGNLPTLYSSTALMLCAVLLALIALTLFQQREKGWKRWLGLAALFLFVSVDESISIHEQLIQPLREAFDLSGIFYFAWVIPYGFFLLILAGLYTRFVFQLPTRTTRLFILAAIVFLSGALGCELVGGYYFESVNESLNLTYAMITTTEETLEMIGVAIFVYALLSYIQREMHGIQICLAAQPHYSKAMAVAHAEATTQAK